ncbi:hypothetical protein HMPREF1129_2641 [Actinomyces naeslundii str. Howell 279]|uniref:Uncharacterized protein n=1 Tax=Actinomyces naeslundii (strain ATCC 12104 / DSM 43013 / CCUG 2238 / JCM 8349 / NCTC 10301 / Howell 279) TaxID=1115803 RepID=J2ZPJ5_ACTNH|nr:hypothetical protein HMPREF1129_2641 [Actinomyces naeslundii str. Howell 279]
MNRSGVKDQGPDRAASDRTGDGGAETNVEAVLVAPGTVVT